MQEKKAPSIIFMIIAVIVGTKLFQHIDFKNLKVEKPWLSLIYFITFVLSVFVIVKNYRNKSGK